MVDSVIVGCMQFELYFVHNTKFMTYDVHVCM